MRAKGTILERQQFIGMTSTPSFVHLQVHSEFSIEKSLLSVNEIVDLAKKSAMSSVALTDTNNVFAMVKFYQAAVKNGIKPIIGAELDIEGTAKVDNTATAKLKQKRDSRDTTTVNYRIILLCQNREGFLNLSELMTRAFMSGHRHGRPYLHEDWLTPEKTKGLIAIEPGYHGFSATHKIRDISQIKHWQNCFTDRYYLGIQRLQTAESRQWEKQLAQLANQAELPIVAINGVCFANPESHRAHEIRGCIQAGQVVDAVEGALFSQNQYWRSQEEMSQLFSDMPNALKNTVEIAKRCNLVLQFDQVYLPDFPVDAGKTLAGHLTDLSYTGLAAKEKYIQLVSPEKAAASHGKSFCHQDYVDRLKVELNIIHKMGFAGYFLIVADFICWAKENDVAVGPGRGSGAGSLVAYVLGITDIDPLPHGLLFERFLNPERVSMPDFDIDFCMIKRDKVIAYVKSHYGQESVAQISTHGSMAAKAAVRDVGRVLAHPYGFVDKIAKLIPNDLGITLTTALKQAPDLAARYREDDQVKALIDMALVLEGRVRNVGRHAGGVVIAPGKLTDFCPLYKEEGSVYQATQLDMGDIEKIGLVKFDFLGLRTLTIIDHTLKAVQNSNQVKIDINHLPLDDPKTYQLLQSCKTTAVFQLESRGFQELIGRLLPDCFEDIVALVALYRPGPLQSGMVDDFIDRKHGRAEVAYLHPCLEPILKETYGVIVYQEQVMQIAQVMAGYTLGAADLLRRAMGKKKPEEMAKQRNIFLEGSQENNIDAKIAEKVFDLMEMFAGYGFNKSHSVAYAMISYQTAYLKTHWLDYFMASVMSSDMDNTDKVVHYIKDSRLMGLKIKPPCINHSEAYFHVEEQGILRFGLGAIKGVGEGFATEIEEHRKKGGSFDNLLDFCIQLHDAKVNRKVLEALIWSGAMDCLGQSRGVMLASIEMILSQKEQDCRNKKSGQGDLFTMDDSDESSVSCHYATNIPQWPVKEQLAAEFAVLGMYFSGHPLDPYRQEIQQMRPQKVAQIKPSARKKIVKVVGLIGKQRRMTTKSGRLFVLIDIIDDSGTFEMACFDDKVQQLQLALVSHEVVVIEGAYIEARNNGQARFNISSIISLEQYRQTHHPTLQITVQENQITKTTAIELGALLRNQESGASPIIVWYADTDTKTPLVLSENRQITINEELLTRLSQVQGVDRVIISYQHPAGV